MAALTEAQHTALATLEPAPRRVPQNPSPTDLRPRPNARARIAARIDRLALGNPGDVKPVGGGVSELRIDYGPGYRVYYARTDRVVYLLLCGGTKATQDVDIKRAIEMTAARAREVSAALQRKPKKRK